MEHISIKLESGIAKQIERSMHEFNYSTKTEFIRDAIRGKLKELKEEREKKKAWQALYAARGILKGKGKSKTDEEWERLRHEAGEEFMEILDKRFNQK